MKCNKPIFVGTEVRMSECQLCRHIYRCRHNCWLLSSIIILIIIKEKKINENNPYVTNKYDERF